MTLQLPSYRGRGAVVRTSASRRQARRRRGFTLLEMLVAVTIFSLAMGLTLVAYVAVLKRAFHSESLLKGATEIRYATDLISQSVRSAGLTPTVEAGGLRLVVAPPEVSWLEVEDGTWLDSAHTVKGTKKNQKNLKLSNVIKTAVLTPAFATASRPAGSLTESNVSSYFKTSGLITLDVDDVLEEDDEITIPGTAFGPEVKAIVKNISNSSNGTQVVSMQDNLTVDVPNGTRIRVLHGRRIMFEVRSSAQTNPGDLRYYPDNGDLTKFTVLAHDIRANPLSDPAVATSAATVPFTITGRFVTINLQKNPRGSTAGRSVQGAVTSVLMRTDPTVQ